MAEASTEKPTAAQETETQNHLGMEERGEISRPTGWMYKPLRIGPIKLTWYASPPTQLVLVALVCFLCPGMFNAVNGLGGGGQVTATVADNSNVALYSTFSVVGFFAGTIVNRLGIKVTLSLGGFGYFVYVASYLSFNHDQNAGFVVFAGALLGLCAGLLWAAQGAIMMSYPGEGSKGRYISWFWMIFNMQVYSKGCGNITNILRGAVIGSLVCSALSESMEFMYSNLT